MKVVGFIYLIRTGLSTSKYGVYASLTILKNGEQQLALAHLFLKIMFASTSSESPFD